MLTNIKCILEYWNKIMGRKKNLKHTQLFVEPQYGFKVAGTLQAFYVNPLASD